MKLANFVTKLQDVLQQNKDTDINHLRRRTGRRLNISGKEVDRIYKRNRKRVVRVAYTGPTKIVCIGVAPHFCFLQSVAAGIRSIIQTRVNKKTTGNEKRSGAGNIWFQFNKAEATNIRHIRTVI